MRLQLGYMYFRRRLRVSDRKAAAAARAPVGGATTAAHSQSASKAAAAPRADELRRFSSLAAYRGRFTYAYITVGGRSPPVTTARLCSGLFARRRRHQRSAWQLPQPARRMHLDPAAPLKDHSKPCYRDVDKTQVTRYCGFYARMPHTGSNRGLADVARPHSHATALWCLLQVLTRSCLLLTRLSLALYRR